MIYLKDASLVFTQLQLQGGSDLVCFQLPVFTSCVIPVHEVGQLQLGNFQSDTAGGFVGFTYVIES